MSLRAPGNKENPVVDYLSAIPPHELPEITPDMLQEARERLNLPPEAVLKLIASCSHKGCYFELAGIDGNNDNLLKTMRSRSWQEAWSNLLELMTQLKRTGSRLTNVLTRPISRRRFFDLFNS